ncbi:MAG: hypothetical protein M3522_03300 [Actinomycetota bacterium]|jgi:crotonobetainyl-CoA:carnitine CoA-transferase CaiB-like acyl-CoA transferase|nr:hypothetical protein [Actinomycetota bacterium]
MLAWERQEPESARAYEAFCHYRDLGPSRSLAKVGQELGKSVGLMERWSSEHDWVARVRALEARDSMLRRDAVQEHLAEKAEDHAKRESRLREKALEVRERAMEKAELMLKGPLYEQRRTIEEGPDGEELTLVMTPARWSISTAIGLYALAQNNAGLSEEELHAVGELDFSALSEEEMIDLLSLEAKIEIRPPDPDRRR